MIAPDSMSDDAGVAVDDRGNLVVGADRQESGSNCSSLPMSIGCVVVGKPQLLQEDRDLPPVGRRPGIEIDHVPVRRRRRIRDARDMPRASLLAARRGFSPPGAARGNEAREAARALPRLTSARPSLVSRQFRSAAWQALVRRLKRAARWRRALRSCGIYVVSFALLAILLSPLWIALILWWD